MSELLPAEDRNVAQGARAMPSRRGFLGALAVGLAFGLSGLAPADASRIAGATTGHGNDADQTLRDGLMRIERRYGGRLGVAASGPESAACGIRLDERFALCSTFKFLAVAYVLRRVDEGREQLTRRIRYGRGDLVEHSPVTALHAGGEGLPLAEICRAALMFSDNTAGNLLLESFGGPAALTRFLRETNDATTRLDRTETALNTAIPGDPRDTTTPKALLETMRRLTIGGALSAASAQRLYLWMTENTTGTHRLRAGLPRDWAIGDKTGTGDHATTNDIAIVHPRHLAPLFIVVLFTQSPSSADGREAAIAECGRLIAAWYVQKGATL